MTIKSKIAAGFASAALFANLAVPAAFADTNLEIWGNGAKSDNTLKLTKEDETTVTQSNNSTVSINVSAKSDTGGNKANGNTGGDTSVKTGDATTTVAVAVVGGVNAASIQNCACGDENTSVKVTNNGKKTKNKADIKDTKKTTAVQASNTSVSADVKAKAKTGKNKANGNTSGAAEVETGASVSETAVEVTGQANILEL
jgi:hypothetical protein